MANGRLSPWFKKEVTDRLTGSLGGERISTLAVQFPMDEAMRDKKTQQRLKSRVRGQIFEMAWAELSKTIDAELPPQGLVLPDAVTVQTHDHGEHTERRDNETRNNSEASSTDSHARRQPQNSEGLDSPTLGALGPGARAPEGSDEATLVGGTPRIASPQVRTGTTAAPTTDEDLDNEPSLVDPRMNRLEMFEDFYEQMMEALSKRLSETLETKNKAKEEEQKARTAKKAEIKAHFGGWPTKVRKFTVSHMGRTCYYLTCYGCCNECSCCRTKKRNPSNVNGDIELGNLDNTPRAPEEAQGQPGENATNPPLNPETAQAKNKGVRPLLPDGQESSTTSVVEAYPQVPASGRLSGAVSNPFEIIGAVGRQHLCPKRGSLRQRSWWNVFRRNQRDSRGSTATDSHDKAERGESAVVSLDEEVANDERVPEIVVRQNG